MPGLLKNVMQIKHKIPIYNVFHEGLEIDSIAYDYTTSGHTD